MGLRSLARVYGEDKGERVLTHILGPISEIGDEVARSESMIMLSHGTTYNALENSPGECYLGLVAWEGLGVGLQASCQLGEFYKYHRRRCPRKS
jgi:hypothetical protein